jgi:hypothetical protein
MDRLHERFGGAWQSGEVERLLLIPAYLLDFLYIHPFSDGNGRMARLLGLLLLYQARLRGRPLHRPGARQVGMLSRGAVGLIIAALGLQTGLLADRSFAIMVIMVLATTVITPPLLRAVFRASMCAG